MNDAAAHLYAHVGADRAAAVTLHRDAYVDPKVFDSEVQRVLRARWLPVARSSAVTNPGDYLCVDLLDELLVVVRDEHGTLRVMSRVCRHRGMPVVDGDGNVDHFSCPYHLWRYGLDGRFQFAPAMNRSTSFDPSNCNLETVVHEEWGGWVFVNLTGDAESLNDLVKPLTARLSRTPPSAFVTADVMEFESPWNWKIMVENFLESYHHIGPHANTLQRVNPGFGTHASDDVGEFTLLENPGIDGADSFVVGCVFPLMLFAITESEVPWGVWYEMDSLKSDRFRLRIHVLMTPDRAADADFVAAVREQVRAIHLEDIPVCQGVQKGYRSALYASGPLSHLEGCLWHFHRFLQRCYRTD